MESNWDHAERLRQSQPENPEPHCPRCGETRMIDQAADGDWYCYVCSKGWPMVTFNDKRLLKQLRIDPT